MTRRESLVAIGAGMACLATGALAGPPLGLPTRNPNGDALRPGSRLGADGRWESVHPTQIRKGDVVRFDKSPAEEMTAVTDCYVDEGVYCVAFAARFRPVCRDRDGSWRSLDGLRPAAA